MSLGRLMRATEGEKYSIIRVTWMTKIFVVGDILSFFVQGGAGGIMAGGDMDKINLGQKIILGGLFLQIIMFGLFILASILFHYRLQKSPTQQSCNPNLRWPKTLFVLYAVSALIMIRNIFRVAEYIEGLDGPLLTVEWPIYVFDALLMAATMLIFYWGYPSTIRPKDLESVASTELTQTQLADVGVGHGDRKL
jgi:RTA1 like protein